MGYSTPIDKKLNKSELLKNIHTQKNQPEAIPYVTSYYKKRWGFCMSQKDFNRLPNGKYRVLIKSSLKKGFLELMHSKIKGKTKKEIFFSSYTCHPSMANNELSGPVLLNAILQYVKKNYQILIILTEFVLFETIGSIAIFQNSKDELKKNVLAGYNLTCVGDRRAYSITNTPTANSLADESLEAALLGKIKLKNIHFCKGEVMRDNIVHH